MKSKFRSVSVIVGVVFILLILGCTTTFNINKIPKEELVKIEMHWSICIYKIDNIDHFYFPMQIPYILELAEGDHVIEISLRDDPGYRQIGTTKLSVKLEKGKRYRLTPIFNNMTVTYSFVEI